MNYKRKMSHKSLFCHCVLNIELRLKSPLEEIVNLTIEMSSDCHQNGFLIKILSIDFH